MGHKKNKGKALKRNANTLRLVGERHFQKRDPETGRMVLDDTGHMQLSLEASNGQRYVANAPIIMGNDESQRQFRNKKRRIEDWGDFGDIPPTRFPPGRWRRGRFTERVGFSQRATSLREVLQALL